MKFGSSGVGTSGKLGNEREQNQKIISSSES